MVQGDKEVAQPQNADDSGEIDRIMKEIEELEKTMETAPAAAPATSSGAAPAAQPSNTQPISPVNNAPALGSPSLVQSVESNDFSETDNVVALRGSESMVESDAVLSTQEPLMKSDSGFQGEGSLGLKVGGCAEVQLEFTRAGVVVTLQCSDDGLSIVTDQGAEFRIPFRKAA